MCEPSPLWCLPETLKLYVTQVVVEPAVGDRKPEASLNRQVFVFFLSNPYEGLSVPKILFACTLSLSTEHVTEHLLMPVQLYFWASFHFSHVVVNLVSVHCLAPLLQLPSWRHCLCYCPMLYKTELVFKAWKMFVICSAVWMWILGTNGTSYSTDDKKASVAFKLHYFIENNPFFPISGYLVGGVESHKF